MKSRGFPTLVALLALLSSGGARPAAAQAGYVAAGAFAGAAGGAYVSLALAVATARAGHYVYSPGAGLWRLTPLPVGAVAGGILGHAGRDELRGGIVYGLLGLAAGAGMGALAGTALWDDAEGTWTGAVVGSALGILVGSVWGALTGGEDGSAAPPALTISIPFGP